jgi:hypothetical protein
MEPTKNFPTDLAVAICRVFTGLGLRETDYRIIDR